MRAQNAIVQSRVRNPLTAGGLFNALAESKTPRDRCYDAKNARVELGRWEAWHGYVQHSARSSNHASDIGHGLGYGIYTSNELVQIELEGEPTGGTFTLTYGGQTTAPIAYNATADEVYDALVALSSLDDSDIVVRGGPLTAINGSVYSYLPVEVEFVGKLSGTDVGAITKDASGLTGGSSPDVSITVLRTGGKKEVLLAAVQKAPGGSLEATTTLFEIDLINGGAWTEIFTGAAPTGLYAANQTGVWNQASEWHFHQYKDNVYMVNLADRGRVRNIGGSAPTGAKPKPPPIPPINIKLLEPHPYGDAASVITAAATPDATGGGWSGAPTLAWTASAGTLSITTTAAEDGLRFVDLDFTSAQDFQFRDVWWVEHWVLDPDTVKISGAVQLILHRNTGSVDITPAKSVAQSVSDYVTNYYHHFENELRFDRADVNTLRLQFYLKAANAKTLAFVIKAYDVWMNDVSPVPFALPDVFTPTPGPIDYACSFYNGTTNTESDLGPADHGIYLGVHKGGWQWLLSVFGSNEAGVSRIYIYRRKRSDNRFYRVPNADGSTNGIANTGGGLHLFYDRWMEEDIEDMSWPQYSGNSIPQWSRSALGCISSWKQCLALGSQAKCYLSRVGDPSSWAPDPEEAPEPPRPDDIDRINDIMRGRTDYVTNNRSDTVYALHGSDSLYAVGARGVYAMVGDRPSNARIFRQLPGAQGAIGYRAVTGFKSGVLVATVKGLFYYSIGRGFQGEDDGPTIEEELTAECPDSWQDLIAPQTSVTVAASSTTQTVGSTEGMMVGDTLYFATAKAFRVVASITSSTVVELTASISTTAGETVVNRTCKERTWVATGGGEVWVGCDNRMMHLNRAGQWEQGVRAHAMRCAVYVEGRGLYTLGVNGVLYFFDQIASDDAGTPIDWYYTTGILEGPRAMIERIEADCEGPGCVVTITSLDRVVPGEAQGPDPKPIALNPNRRSHAVSGVQPAGRYRIKLSGQSASDKIDSIAFIMKESPVNLGG